LATNAAPMLESGARLVDDVERRFQCGGQLIGDDACQNVGVAARRKRHHDLRRPGRIVALGHSGGCGRDGENRGRHSDQDRAFHQVVSHPTMASI
jgi:hypothetical protein